jgi:hypothetical protein
VRHKSIGGKVVGRVVLTVGGKRGGIGGFSSAVSDRALAAMVDKWCRSSGGSLPASLEQGKGFACGGNRGGGVGGSLQNGEGKARGSGGQL